MGVFCRVEEPEREFHLVFRDKENDKGIQRGWLCDNLNQRSETLEDSSGHDQRFGETSGKIDLLPIRKPLLCNNEGYHPYPAELTDEK